MKTNKSILRSDGAQTFIASILCIIAGLVVGLIALLLIEPSGAFKALTDVLKNFFTFPSAAARMKYFGTTLVKTAPLLMCSLSVLFAYKVGLFNIGAAGQYVVGTAACLYMALGMNMPWYVCLIGAMVAGAVWGGISGILKSYCNVNEVISCIMLNWIGLYLTNMLLTKVKEPTSPYTLTIKSTNTAAIMPNLGLNKFFSNNAYVTIAIPLVVVVTVIIWIILEKTRFGYELRATGNNKNAAKYAGMNEKRNIILTMVIAGALAGMAAGVFYLTDVEQWSCTQTSVPAMGFNGIAAAFLGGLNPIGAIFSSYFIEHITLGGSYVDKAVYPSQISDFISSIIIYLCGFVMFFKLYMKKRQAASDEKKAAKLAKTQEGGDK